MESAPTDADDAALLDAWRAGDRAAGEQLFERHFDAIYRFFERKGLGDVGDLVQRTFLGCVEARDRYRGASSFRTFLFAIARHELYGLFRQRRAQVDFGVSSLADLAPGPSTLLRERSQREILLAALRAIPLELQLAVELRFWEGLTGPDLAIALAVPEGTVRSRLRRALEALRGALDEHELGKTLRTLPASDDAFDAWAEQLRVALDA
ncbi:MAG: sigma-70 family RNA polymerase sigma factor [Deltaproteobacteria bacterium]|nr:sigma-70 family RNA polymerase sigma factor [Deltaproteobacteria bacterium]